MLAFGVSATPSAPALPSDGSPTGDSLKKTKDSSALHHLSCRHGIGFQPSADRLHGHFLARQRAGTDQGPADRRVGPAVLARIGDADDRAIVEHDAARTLDVQEENRDGIIAIEQHGSRRRLCVDFGAPSVGDEMLTGEPSGETLALPFGTEQAEIDTDEIARQGVNGRLIAIVAGAAAVQQWFVVPGK